VAGYNHNFISESDFITHLSFILYSPDNNTILIQDLHFEKTSGFQPHFSLPLFSLANQYFNKKEVLLKSFICQKKPVKFFNIISTTTPTKNSNTETFSD